MRILLIALLAALPASAQPINPYPRAVLKQTVQRRWSFERETSGWEAKHDCALTVADGRLRIQSTGNDPYLHGPRIAIQGPVQVWLTARCKTAGAGQIFWRTQRQPTWSENQSARFCLRHDGKLHRYRVSLGQTGQLIQLRLDPGSSAGRIEVESIELLRVERHPLEITQVRSDTRQITLTLFNHGTQPVRIGSSAIPAGKSSILSRPVGSGPPFESRTIVLRPQGLPPVRRTISLYRPTSTAAWKPQKAGSLLLQQAQDGSGTRIFMAGQLVATITGKHRPTLQGDTISLTGDDVIVRVQGALDQGLFAGLEYLGRGEHSSSSADIETAERLRFEPDPLQVTWPLMAVVTDRVAVALTWQRVDRQPVFASPNFFDGTSDHRLALRGSGVIATLRICRSDLAGLILWAAKRRGLPPLPSPPRTAAAQTALCLSAFHGPLKGKQGWGHCAEKRWARQPYADHASTLFRLTGKLPALDRLTPGGAHIRNDAAFFLSGRAADWLSQRRAAVDNLLDAQQKDGSWRYSGKYRRGHFEDTASGLVARKAAELLSYARQTGQRRAWTGGLKALAYLKRFRTPRGAQTWELSLHTPDILASAHLVNAYLDGYLLTKRSGYLSRARYWAISGLPFVYLRGGHPTMLYATVPVYGATNWRAPNWIGLPVQWCGIVYAHALARLARHERSLDWSQVARGILITAERMQYPTGRLAGCLPDFFELATQRGAGPSINPCSLISLQRVLAGQIDSLALAAHGGRRVLSPFPVRIVGGKAVVTARQNLSYQLLVDGTKFITVRSRGTDSITLD